LIGWDGNFSKRNAKGRKSFGNVFAAAAAEDERRAELGNSFHEDYLTLMCCI
jgi:hypothetical protein